MHKICFNLMQQARHQSHIVTRNNFKVPIINAWIIVPYIVQKQKILARIIPSFEKYYTMTQLYTIQRIKKLTTRTCGELKYLMFLLFFLLPTTIKTLMSHIMLILHSMYFFQAMCPKAICPKTYPVHFLSQLSP